MDNFTFNLTEEAFLLSSLHEVVKVWARGSGQASFNLDINDGAANLKLCFQLGHPCEPHYDPGVQHNQPRPHFIPQHQDQEVGRKKRHKGPARREKDRARAAAFQARLQSDEPRLNTAAPAAVKLPFSGNILPLKKPVAAVSAQVTTPSSLSTLEPVSTPKKSSSFPRSFNVDVGVAKKQLFPHQLPPALPHAAVVLPQQQQSTNPSTLKPSPTKPPSPKTPPSNQSPPSMSFKKKEEELWTKLFSS